MIADEIIELISSTIVSAEIFGRIATTIDTTTMSRVMDLSVTVSNHQEFLSALLDGVRKVGSNDLAPFVHGALEKIQRMR